MAFLLVQHLLLLDNFVSDCRFYYGSWRSMTDGAGGRQKNGEVHGLQVSLPVGFSFFSFFS